MELLPQEQLGFLYPIIIAIFKRKYVNTVSFFFLIEYFALIERSTYTWKNWKEKTQSQYVLILSSWYQWYAKKKLERTKTRGKIEDLQFYALHAIAQINT